MQSIRGQWGWALLVLLLALGLAGCGASTTPAADSPAGAGSPPTAEAARPGTVVKTEKGQYRDITPAELKTMMDHKDFFQVDVHVPHEGRMPNLDARIPYDQIAQHLDELPADKSAKIVLTCRSSHMSGIASHTLADLGYTNVYNMVGGFNAWRDAGYPFSPEETPEATP
jgi:rhodanese-related sulfurtransferase